PAEALLEQSDASVEEAARLVGFGTAAGLRDQFSRRRGVSPRAYRQTLRAGARSGAGAAPVQLAGAGAGGAAGWAPAGRGAGQPTPGRGGARSAGVAGRMRAARRARSTRRRR